MNDRPGGIPGRRVADTLMWQTCCTEADGPVMPRNPRSTAPPARRAPPRCAPAGASHDERRLEHKRGVVLRLKRAEGQIRGVLRMIEADDPCDAIAQQLAAVRNALDRAFFEMMACTLESEIAGAPDSDERQDRVGEVLRILSKYA
jgi:DNA-binding FrmR family transcriptional regulator